MKFPFIAKANSLLGFGGDSHMMYVINNSSGLHEFTSKAKALDP